MTINGLSHKRCRLRKTSTDLRATHRRSAARHEQRGLLVLGTLLLLWGVGGMKLAACSTPVYQYALENWPADLYHLEMRHNGLDEEAVEAAARAMFVPDDGDRANIQMRLSEDASLPRGEGRMAVRYPFHPAGMPPIWEGQYSPEALRELADSPVRQDLVEQLMGGATSVFLFLKSGSDDADREARSRLRTVLDELEKNLELPLAPSDIPGEEPLEPAEISFPILDISRDDPKEDVLRTMLLKTEADLTTFDEPMVFPVFGRGRALYAIVGRGINRDVLIEACLFLTGACSCQVKAQNPGVDLLLRADWDQVLEAIPYEEVELPPLTGVGAMAEATEEPLPQEPLSEDLNAYQEQPPDTPLSRDDEGSSALAWGVGSALAVAALALAGATLAVVLRR